ncbi:MAG: ATP synthase F1 subunit epsilon [Candidatus Spechtbacterales bacterium]|nr:ATP synthase F1 subunit epsilon [Candidatus Spechtbacterales bacterium]
MNNKVKLKIITPEKVIYEDEVEKLSVPTKDGVVSIRPDHMLLVSVIEAGKLIVTKESRDIDMAVTRGFLEVRSGSEVVIMADTAERIEDMDEEKIKAARKRAEKAMQNAKDADDVDFARMEEVVAREISRLKILSKRKR